MIYGFILIVHIIIALSLVVIILIQGGRGGLGEAMGGAAAQSLFGGGANTVITKITAVAAGIFMVTCLVLAALSTAKGRSVVERMPETIKDVLPTTPETSASDQGTSAPIEAREASETKKSSEAAPTTQKPVGETTDVAE